MPILEFKCDSCGTEFEHLMLHSSAPPKCPSCGSNELERVISTSAVSSHQTRERALRGAKERAGSHRHEKEVEEHKMRHRHMGDDH